MDNLTYKNVNRARKILNLGKRATMSDIRTAYKKLSLKYHPDRCGDDEKEECEEKFKKISRAYKLIMDYCDLHKFSFAGEKVKQVSPDEAYKQHIDRFYGDWWGKKEDK